VQSKRTDLREEKIKDPMNVQKEEKVENSLKTLMKGEGRAIVEDSFENIQEQEQDNNEEEEVSSI